MALGRTREKHLEPKVSSLNYLSTAGSVYLDVMPRDRLVSAAAAAAGDYDADDDADVIMK